MQKAETFLQKIVYSLKNARFLLMQVAKTLSYCYGQYMLCLKSGTGVGFWGEFRVLYMSVNK